MMNMVVFQAAIQFPLDVPSTCISTRYIAIHATITIRRNSILIDSCRKITGGDRLTRIFHSVPALETVQVICIILYYKKKKIISICKFECVEIFNTYFIVSRSKQNTKSLFYSKGDKKNKLNNCFPIKQNYSQSRACLYYDRRRRRNCSNKVYEFQLYKIAVLGQKYAMLEEKTLLAYILKNFKVRAVETEKTARPSIGLILKPLNGLLMSFHLRK